MGKLFTISEHLIPEYILSTYTQGLNLYLNSLCHLTTGTYFMTKTEYFKHQTLPIRLREITNMQRVRARDNTSTDWVECYFIKIIKSEEPYTGFPYLCLLDDSFFQCFQNCEPLEP